MPDRNRATTSDPAPAGSVPVVRSGATRPGRMNRPAWRFHVLVAIANFTSLRRHLGCARAALLVHDVIERLAIGVSHARIVPVGRDLAEIAFEGDDQDDLAAAMVVWRNAAARPFVLDGEWHDVALIFGAASGRTGQADEICLVEEAEAALAEARGADHAITHAIAPAGTRDAARLAAELDLAIERDELVMMYQPKIHVRRQEIGSAEGLVRWRHPERGLILPGDFIPVAEQANLIGRLTLWTINRAITDQSRLAAAGYPLRLFINIAGQLLADEGFVREACRLAMQDGVSLGFEVTETSVIRDPDSAIRNLQRFADIGITIAIDDYGAGLSSLAYLKQLPARELKIDKLFVTRLTSSNRDPLIVRSTIDLAHALDMEVVAEGVETHAALALLTVMGCDMVQGFLISRPIAVEALITFLGEDHHHTAPQDTRASFNRLASAWKRG